MLFHVYARYTLAGFLFIFILFIISGDTIVNPK